jgi:hypothetical protein
MKFLYEDVANQRNFISNTDVNRSGINRFAISPLLTAVSIYCWLNNIDGLLENSDNNQTIDEPYIIPACVNHSPDDWTGYDPKVKSLFLYLNEKYLNDLRNNKAFLLLDQSLEGYQTHWLWDWFHKEAAEWEIAPDRIIYVTGNMIANETYDKWCNDKHIQNRMCVVPYAHFELDMAMTAYQRNETENKLPSFEDHINYKSSNEVKTFACLNKRIRQHRVWFYNYLYNSGLIDKGLVSMNQFDYHGYNFEGKTIDLNVIDEISKNLPLIVHGKANNEFDDNFYIRRFNDKISLDTYMTVISEAHCGDSDQTMFLSEKTFKVIAVNHPFIIMGNKDSMKMMRTIGYKTFDGYIDESYDSLPTHERLQSIIESIRKVDNIKDKLEWYKSLEEIIKFNYNTLIGKLFKIPDAMTMVIKHVEKNSNYVYKENNEKKLI